MDSANGALTKNLGELFSREDKKSIPVLKSSISDKLITHWLKEAERVARNNNWDDEHKIKFPPTVLREKKAEWHSTYENDTLSYGQWCSDLIDRFGDEADMENLKQNIPISLTESRTAY